MIDSELFLQWAKDYFGEENISFARGGEEICTNSPFTEDFKHHLWMNPSGGKSDNPENGSYRCWYTDRSGSLVKLVADLEGIDWEEALELISEQVSLRELEKRLDKFFQVEAVQSTVFQSNAGLLQLPENTYLIDSLGKNETFYHRATQYLKNRKIPTDDLFVCTSGWYGNRIVIPYYNKRRELVWWNARTLSSDPKVLRYMKPNISSDTGISQENVFFMRSFPKPNSQILIMEGEFDVIALHVCGIHAASCGGGKSLSDNQINLLRPYIPVLAFDADGPGKQALIKVGKRLLEQGFKDIFYVRPPSKYKDWNKLYIETDAETVNSYIKKHIKRFHSWTADALEMLDI